MQGSISCSLCPSSSAPWPGWVLDTLYVMVSSHRDAVASSYGASLMCHLHLQMCSFRSRKPDNIDGVPDFFECCGTSDSTWISLTSQHRFLMECATAGNRVFCQIKFMPLGIYHRRHQLQTARGFQFFHSRGALKGFFVCVDPGSGS
jgi:hypothetical protein